MKKTGTAFFLVEDMKFALPGKGQQDLANNQIQQSLFCFAWSAEVGQRRKSARPDVSYSTCCAGVLGVG